MRAPGDVVLHPVALSALAIWIINDHLLKGLWGNGLTGKLSDVASLVFVPLLLVAVVELLAQARGRALGQGALRAVGVTAAALTGLVMATINLFEPFAWLYRHGLGLLQWPFLIVSWLGSGQAVGGPGMVDLTMDPTDLWTLPALILPLGLLARRARRRGSPDAGSAVERTTASAPIGVRR